MEAGHRRFVQGRGQRGQVEGKPHLLLIREHRLFQDPPYLFEGSG